MGLQAAPEVADQLGGLDSSQSDQQRVQQIGLRIVQDLPAGTTPYEYAYHLLADPETTNAFALPGGQIFITRALDEKLQTDGELVAHPGTRNRACRRSPLCRADRQSALTQGLSGAGRHRGLQPQQLQRWRARLPNGCHRRSAHRHEI